MAAVGLFYVFIPLIIIIIRELLLPTILFIMYLLLYIKGVYMALIKNEKYYRISGLNFSYYGSGHVNIQLEIYNYNYQGTFTPAHFIYNWS